MEILGAFSALTSAFCYALASVFFCRLGKEVSPAGITITKSAIACAITGCLLLVFGDMDPFFSGLVEGTSVKSSSFTWFAISTNDFLLLVLSGFLGITIGDTAYFATLNALGTRKTLLLDTLGPAVTIILAVLFLGETISYAEILSIIAILSGIGWVLRERLSPDSPKDEHPITWQGLAWGGVNIFSHALSIITAKNALNQVPSLEASLIRQASAMLIISVWIMFTTGLIRALKPLWSKKNLSLIFGASACGSFLGIWLSMLGLKLTPASIATTLNTTTPIFILPINRIIEKQHVSLRAALGAFIAFLGAAALIWMRHPTSL